MLLRPGGRGRHLHAALGGAADPLRPAWHSTPAASTFRSSGHRSRRRSARCSSRSPRGGRWRRSGDRRSASAISVSAGSPPACIGSVVLIGLGLALPAGVLGRVALQPVALGRDFPLLGPANALQAFSQEVQFRGLLLGALERTMSPRWANVCQAAVFGLAHLAISYGGPEAPFVPDHLPRRPRVRLAGAPDQLTVAGGDHPCGRGHRAAVRHRPGAVWVLTIASHALTATVAACIALTVAPHRSARRPARRSHGGARSALRGVAITPVSAIGDTIMVRTATGATLLSTDGGKTFATAPEHRVVPAARRGDRRQAALGDRLRPGACCTCADHGCERHSAARSGLARSRRGRGSDRGTSRTPRRGGRGEHGRHRLAPRPGRRLEARRSSCSRQSLVQGVPRVTSVTAFTAAAQRRHLSRHRWLCGPDQHRRRRRLDSRRPRAPRLRVLAVRGFRRVMPSTPARPTGSGSTCSRTLPAPPAYQDAALIWRWLGIGAVTLVASTAALLAMVRLVPRRLEA